jgi:SAM-dependent methyltransferase
MERMNKRRPLGLSQLVGLLLLLLSLSTSHAFAPPIHSIQSFKSTIQTTSSTTSLRMANMDMVTYLRTEWIAAALCTNQTPRSADVCLQLGTEDGRLVTFVPRTIRQIITSSAEKDGTISVGARRQLKKNEEIRKCAKVKIVEQPADDLFEVEDNSVDVVISLQCAQRMIDNGRDWKKGVREACRVLKPGGRLLWVEQTTLNGESYLDYLENLYTQTSSDDKVTTTTTEEGPEGGVSNPTLYPTFDDIGWDDVNLVLIPHTAGVAVKAFDPAAIETEEQKEKARMDDLSLTAFERGIKKRKKKKKKKAGEELAQ